MREALIDIIPEELGAAFMRRRFSLLFVYYLGFVHIEGGLVVVFLDL